MANDFTVVLPKLLAQGLMALRQQAIMPRLVNRAYEELAGEKGSTVTVPIPSAITVQDVTPGPTPPSTNDVTPTQVQIAMTRWKEAPFYLTDKDMMEAVSGTIPMQASEAVKAIANEVDTFLFSLSTQFYGFTGTPGVTPFASDTTAATQARAILAKQLADPDPRYCVINPDAEGNALNLRAFQDASFSGSAEGIIKGQIGQKLGALWLMDQNVPTFTAGTCINMVVNNAGNYAAGATSIAMDIGTGTAVVGDIFTIAGLAGTYSVQTVTGAAPTTSITFVPGLAAAVLDEAVITFKASHVRNLLFHRDAISLASRPLESSNAANGLGHFISAVDPVSKLALRLEVTREHKRTRFSYDILYGAQVTRKEFGVIIAG